MVALMLEMRSSKKAYATVQVRAGTAGAKTATPSSELHVPLFRLRTDLALLLHNAPRPIPFPPYPSPPTRPFSYGCIQTWHCCCRRRDAPRPTPLPLLLLPLPLGAPPPVRHPPGTAAAGGKVLREHSGGPLRGAGGQGGAVMHTVLEALENEGAEPPHCGRRAEV